ncbi:ATP-binding cassette domain-containing protein [Rhabdaerophilum sp. SD176]|uniref:ATP-binding cassette domain-containing protein n=1 Tax=Rhabdaerophilum sp. SD176 TaxID=2983548 RepID=UPI0024DF81C9|nr:ATP-binding cassette domain-containing protein [Rhabdaerophilum sp. SD176]
MSESARQQSEPAGSEGEAPFGETVARLRERFRSMNETAQGVTAELGPASHPVADLQRLARLCGRPVEEPVPDAPPASIPGPATLALIADKLGFSVIWEAMSLRQLDSGLLPAVVMLRDRSSRLVIGRTDENHFRLLGPEGAYDVGIDGLDRAASSSIFRVIDLARPTPRPVAAPDPVPQEPSAGSAPGGPAPPPLPMPGAVAAPEARSEAQRAIPQAPARSSGSPGQPPHNPTSTADRAADPVGPSPRPQEERSRKDPARPDPAVPGNRAARPEPTNAEPAMEPAPDVLSLLRLALEGQGGRIAYLCLGGLLINLLGMALPLFSMAVFDRVIPHGANETLWALSIGAILALGLETVLRHARLKLGDAVGHEASHVLQARFVRRLLFARAQRVPRQIGPIMPLIQEMEQSGRLMPQLIASVAIDLPFFIFLMLFIFSISGPVVLAPLVATFLVVLCHVAAHVMSRRALREAMGAQGKQVQQVMDMVGGIERLRITNAAPSRMAAWEQVSDEAGYTGHLARYWNGMAAQLAAVIVQVSIVAALVIGTYRIQDASMTIGALSAVILLVNRSMMPISILAGLVFRALQNVRALSALAPFLVEPIEQAGDRVRPIRQGLRGKIDLHRLTVVYPGELRPCLRDVTLSIAPGERVALVGKAGSGKSTLLRVLARLVEPQDGRILLDEQEIGQYDPAWLRAHLALMPQDSTLFDGTLHDNLMAGLPDVDPAYFEQVNRLAGVADFASLHPAGYTLEVGPGGQRLSGGERQSVSLARALMGAPTVLLLDEPTSAMDNGLEARVIADLRKLETERMGIIVATHRLPVLAMVDRIIWLDQGRVVADGPKDQILKRFGVGPAAA